MYVIMCEDVCHDVYSVCIMIACRCQIICYLMAIVVCDVHNFKNAKLMSKMIANLNKSTTSIGFQALSTHAITTH